MAKNIYVFCGYKGSGKDTSSEFFMNSLQLPYEHLSFAGKVKQVCWDLYKNKLKNKDRLWGNKDQKEEVIDGWFIDEKIKTSCGFTESLWSGRRLLQWFGTEVGRYSYEDIWVDHLKEQLFTSNLQNFTITDCRFLSEFNMLKKLDKNNFNTTFFLINRGMADNEYSTHASEKELSLFTFDHLIDNNGSLNTLKNELLTIRNYK